MKEDLEEAICLSQLLWEDSTRHGVALELVEGSENDQFDRRISAMIDEIDKVDQHLFESLLYISEV